MPEASAASRLQYRSTAMPRALRLGAQCVGDERVALDIFCHIGNVFKWGIYDGDPLLQWNRKVSPPPFLDRTWIFAFDVTREDPTGTLV